MTALTFFGKKKKVKKVFQGVFFENTRKNYKLHLALVPVFVLKPKALY